MEICGYDKCTGCMACKNVCPSECIDFKEDSVGETHPVIDESRCINCGSCQKVCPVNTPVDLNSIKSAYACISSVNRNKSASGGVAFELYSYAIKNGFDACGVMFDRNMELGYSWVTTDNIERTRNSKYAFSSTNDIYKEIKEKLENEKSVLFIGMPCQTAGLKGFLSKEYENLITVDILCHGMPPFSYFREYIKNYKLTNALFRDKKYTLRLIDGKKTVYKMPAYKDRYFAGYTSQLFYREACYKCNFAQKSRVGDITIGDYYGSLKENFKPYNQGISSVLINTEKGKEFFGKAKENLKIHITSVSSLINSNEVLREPAHKHPLRNDFLEEYKKNGFDKASDLIINDIIKQNKKVKLKSVTRQKLSEIYYYFLSFSNGAKMIKYGRLFRKCFRNTVERSKLKNHSFSILSNNCIGGVISSDLGERFNSPTINLYIKPSDFVKFLGNIGEYLKLELKEIKADCDYPVGMLGDIPIYFKHYNSFEIAAAKWEERKNRLDFNNLYVMMTDRWCCSYETLKCFEALPYKNKVCFTAKDYPEFNSCKRVMKNNDGVCVGIITNITNIFGKRLYQYAEKFNYIEFLNTKGE